MCSMACEKKSWGKGTVFDRVLLRQKNVGSRSTSGYGVHVRTHRYGTAYLFIRIFEVSKFRGGSDGSGSVIMLNTI